MRPVVVKFNGSLYPGEVVKERGRTMDVRFFTRVGTPEMRERVVCVRKDDLERSKEEQVMVMHALYRRDEGLLSAAHGWLPREGSQVARRVEQLFTEALAMTERTDDGTADCTEH